MTNQDAEIIAQVLRQRVTDIEKTFQIPGAHVAPENVEAAMKTQIQILAHELGLAFGKEDPTFDNVWVAAAAQS